MNAIRSFAALLALSLALAGSALMAGEPPAVGNSAPGFHLQDQNGEWHDLEDYRGTWLAVYFYPKDDTPGCTKEACNFRDNIYAFKAIGAEVVGISVDDVDSHREFSEKYKLPFVILADHSGATAESYGVLRDWKLTKIAAVIPGRPGRRHRQALRGRRPGKPHPGSAERPRSPDEGLAPDCSEPNAVL